MAAFQDDEEREDNAPVEKKRRRPRKKPLLDDEDGAPAPGRDAAGEDAEEETNSLSTGNVPLDILLDFRDDCIDWAKGHVLMAAVLGIGGLLLFFTLTGLTVRYFIQYANRPTLATIFAAYDLGSYGEAKKLAEVVLRYAPETDLTTRGGALFVMGAATCAMAELAWNTNRQPYYLAAANYLREAEEYGFPPDRRAQGFFLLGKSLYLSGELEQCRRPLQFALEYGTDNTKLAYWYLANSRFLDVDPDPGEALRYLRIFRRDPLVTEDEIYESNLLECLILLQLGQIDAAERLFLRIPLFDRFETMRFFVSGQIAFFKARQLDRQADDLENSRHPIAVGEIPIAPAPVDETMKTPEKRDVKTNLPSTDEQFPVALPPVEPSSDFPEPLIQPIQAVPPVLPDSSPSPFDDTETERLLPQSSGSPVSSGPLLGPPDPSISSRAPFPQTVIRRESTPVCPAPVVQANWEDSQPPLFRRMSWLIGRVESSGASSDTPNFDSNRSGFESEASVPTPDEANAPETRPDRPVDPDAVILLPKEDALDATAPAPPAMPLTGDESREPLNPIQGRVWRLRRQAVEKYREAIGYFLQVRRRDTFVPRWLRQAELLEGLCYEGIGDPVRARETYLSLSETYPGTSEAAAADFFWAEIERKLGRPENALSGYARSFDSIRASARYACPWLTTEEISARCEEHLHDDTVLKEYQRALTLIYLLRDIMPDADRARRRGEVYEAWAVDLRQQSATIFGDEGDRLRRESREKFRRAGEAFEELARYEFDSPDFDQRLWRCAENYREGRDFRRSIRFFKEYLRINWRERQPEALLYLGEMYLHLDRLDESVQTLEQAIRDYPNHTLVPRMRLVLSRAYYEKKDWSKAAQLLQANLLGEFAPSASIYRDSMYALGKLHYERGDLVDAIPYLEDAVLIHPNAIQAADGHYYLSQAYLNRADERLNMLEAAPLESVKEAIREEVRADRQRALAHFEKTEELLVKRQNAIGLSKAEQLMLRNAVFGSGAVLMQLERFPEAIPVFDLAATRYQDAPEGLDALMQIAVAYRRLGRPEEALPVLNRAEVVLNRLEKTGMIPPENDWASRIQVQKNLVNLNE